MSKGYTYSGSNNADEVAWYWKNAGDKYLSGDWSWPIIESNNNTTKSIGTRKPNELGIYDMSGNVENGVGTGMETWITKAVPTGRYILRLC
ncbi:hypothetical protein KAI36_00999 [Paenibacillus sp. S02]|nr:hypothetical protein KAI36_00999 [Paenibacillus sp. S02]